MKRSFKKGLSTAEQILAMPKGPPDQLRAIDERLAALMFMDGLDHMGRCEAEHGEVTLKRWPAPSDRVPAGLDELRARHPDLLAKHGPMALLRVLLADPAKMWSARQLAASAELRDALPRETASARAVGRWLVELASARLALAEGRGTAKRWRLGAA